jgi:hypothetical protein
MIFPSSHKESSIYMKRLFIAALALAALSPALGATPALAVSPVVSGSYNVTFYPEPYRLTAATQCVVFTPGNLPLPFAPGVGVTTYGTWTSPTFAGWSGQYFQEGDHIRWYGFTTGGLATSETGNTLDATATNNVTAVLIGGQDFNHFLRGATSSIGNWSAVKVASCPRVATLAAPNATNADPAGTH